MRVKMSKQPPPAPIASAIGPCPTLIQTSRTPRHWKVTQDHRTTRPLPGLLWPFTVETSTYNSRLETEIRLYIWYLMRRISSGCTTDSHQFYASFMGMLSNTIFQWDEADLNLLKKAKRAKLKAKPIPAV